MICLVKNYNTDVHVTIETLSAKHAKEAEEEEVSPLR